MYFGLDGFNTHLAMCMNLLFLSSLWNHAQLGGGSGAKRLMRTLDYGWVERCSGVASCGTSQLQNKYLLLFLCLISANYLFYELIWAGWMFACLNGCYCFQCILHVLYSCICYKFNACLCFYVHGTIFPVWQHQYHSLSSPSSIWGVGMWQDVTHLFIVSLCKAVMDWCGILDSN